jgi:hypothetical protein
VVGSAAFEPTLTELISGKLQATSFKDWIKTPGDGQAMGAMGQSIRP